MKLVLQIKPNEKISRDREFSTNPIRIGRDTDCELTLGIPRVSGKHAELSYDTNSWSIRDLNSTNGTFVNDTRIKAPMTVDIGDVIQLGEGGPILVFKSFVETEPEHEPEISQPATPISLSDSKRSVALLDVDDVDSEDSNETPIPAVVVPDASAAPDPVVPSAPIPSTRRDAANELNTLPQDKPIAGPAKPVGEAGNTGGRRFKSAEQRKGETDEDRAASPKVFHSVSLAAFGATAVLLGIGYWLYTRELLNPARGYTGFGLLVGIVGTFLLLMVGLYAARKRWFQEHLPGRLLTWLRLHLWMSLIGIWMIFLHAGFNIDGGSGTYTVLALLGTVVTGIGGWFLYRQVPGRVYATVGNLASDDVVRQITEIDHKIEDSMAGRSAELAQYATAVMRGKKIGFNPSSEEAVVANEIATFGQQKAKLKSTLKRQKTLRFVMRSWLVLHIPIALAFFGVLAYHVYDEMEVKSLTTVAGPHDFADPESCAVCHKDHYDEWIGSMHAIAQLSPVTDLQNRLVVFKDRFDNGSQGVLVGDLCVKCHAPTSRLGDFADLEDEILDIDQRAPAGHFGVSCVACHQLSNIKKSKPFAEDKDKVDYKNAENLVYTHSRKMFGPLGGFDPRRESTTSANRPEPSVGNREHQGVFGAHFTNSSFCASCHTVMVDPEGPKNLVTLQNTYKEWLDGGDKVTRGVKINWDKQRVDCIDCHGKPLDRVVKKAEAMELERVDLTRRASLFIKEIKNNARADLPLEKQFAAQTPTESEINKLNPIAAVLLGGAETEFDRPLQTRRKHLHTFVGVDYHLEPNLPYRDPARLSENAKIQQQNFDNVADLLKIAAAIKIDEAATKRSRINGENFVHVDVLNLATGHHLPAGFAFAREMWLEVSLSPRDTGGLETFKVFAGGKDGRALRSTEMLDKYGEGRAGRLKNFQAVLWNGSKGSEIRRGDKLIRRTGETVLQNECVKVLKGKDAVNQGFVDRENFLLPGEIRQLKIKMPSREFGLTRRVRVRLRFRNYPPEFLDQLADRFLRKQDVYPQTSPVPDTEMFPTVDKARAARTRNLINGLRIFEMASDTVSIR